MSTRGRPRVLITSGATYNVEHYVHAVEASGAEAVVARPGEELIEGWDAVVLSGGADVSPARFGAVVPDHLSGSVEVEEPRDRLEWQVLDEAERRGLPVLAICRGIQLLNVHRGGTLRLDLPGEGFTAIDHRQRARIGRPVHDVAVLPGRLRATLDATWIPVNSSHHQAVRRVAPDLRAVAFAPDGVIEALESADGRLVGVQWHPERLFDAQEAARRLFADLVLRVEARVPAA